MVRSCPLAELFSALTQSGYSKSPQSRATKHGVGLGSNPRCDCVKQQNDPYCSPIAALPSGQCCLLCLDSSSNSTAAIPIACALKLCSALAVFLTPPVARKTPFRPRVSHCDRHVMAGDSKATIFRDHDAATRKGT